MPPKSLTRRGGARSVAVSATHPANVAAAATKKAAGGREAIAVSTRESPPRASETADIARIQAEAYAQMHAPVASVAPDSAETTPGVAVLVDGGVARKLYPPACAPPRNDSPGRKSPPVEAGEGLGLAPSFPPLWNAWWCGGCRALHFVGDGGELRGACIMCGDSRPVRNDTMLDPEQVAQLRANPGLSYDTTLLGNAGPSTSFGRKTMGISEEDLLASSPKSSRSFESDDDYERTDLEVSKYPFVERLDHYMERYSISDENCRSVELAIMVEAGSIVREMGTMTKERREQAYYQEYMSLISDIPNERFEEDDVRVQMQLRFKGMRKGGDMNPTNLHRKYETEMTSLKKFAYKFPGFGNLSKLPSGTAQLQQLRRPIVAKLWAEQNPAREDLYYDDPVAVATQIPPTWWMEHSLCKYILSVLIHKDNKDISTQPTKLPQGPMRKDIRKVTKRTVEQERATARVQRLASGSVGDVSIVSDKDDVDQQAKKAKIDGMRSVIELKKIEAINTQIAVMERLENVYVARMGRDAYERKLVNLANKLPDMLEEEQPWDVEQFSPQSATSDNDGTDLF